MISQSANVTGAAAPFFFESTDGARLFGVWRAATQAGNIVWVICPPFAEEEKSAHRTLVEICEALRGRGQSSLFFAYRGTGDSSGDFSEATLSQWCADILAACAEAQRRAPAQRLGLLGLRLGASLAVEVAVDAGANHLILMEPILSGRQFIGAMSKRKSLRAMMTQHEAGQSNEAESVQSTPAVDESTIEDFDGWGIGQELRAELESLDLSTRASRLSIPALILQLGPREQIAAPLQKFADALGAPVTSVVMQPFWNLLDYVRTDALSAVVVHYQFSNPDSSPTPN